MNGLQTLVAYVEAQREGRLDWPAFLKAVAVEYRGKAALQCRRCSDNFYAPAGDFDAHA